MSTSQRSGHGPGLQWFASLVKAHLPWHLLHYGFKQTPLTAVAGCFLYLLPPQPAELPPLRLPAAKRLVAIGDLHGDLDKVGSTGLIAVMVGMHTLTIQQACWKHDDV